MTDHGWTCSICAQNPAAFFCMCDRPEVLYCTSCFYSHFDKNVANMHHPSFRISTLPRLKEPGNLGRVQGRISVLQEVRELTQRNLGEVDACIGELTAKVDQLTKYYSEAVEVLRKNRREIEASLEELETTITEEQPELRSPYGRTMRAYLDRKSTFFELFEYRVNALDPKSLLDVRNQRYSLYEPKLFPSIAGKTLRLYDLVWKESRSFSLSSTFTDGTVFCLLDSSNVLCIGGLPPTASVFLLDISEQKLSARPNMSIARSYTGVIKAGAYVYAFGSYNPHLASCEKCAVASKAWTNLKDMSAARYCFSPALHIDDIYLARAQNARAIEVFNTEREAFRTLSFTIPASITDSMATFIVAGELYILSSNQVAKWKIDSGEEMQTSSIIGGGVPWSNSPAFVVGSEVILVTFNTGVIFKFNYETKSVVS